MIRTNVTLREFSHYQIGGPAAHFCDAKSLDRLLASVERWRGSHPKPHEAHRDMFVLGGGTNVLIGDEGYQGLVIRPSMATISLDGARVHVDAGVSVEKLLDFVISKGLSGLEWAGGLPGTFGGAVRGNAGAFGGEIRDSLASVVNVDLASKKLMPVTWSSKKCRFGYRSSAFKELDVSGKAKRLVLAATLALTKGDKREIRRKIEEKIAHRAARHPIEYPNIGSIFKNVPLCDAPKTTLAIFQDKVKQDPFPILPAAVLIDAAGLKGVSFGGAMISPKHPNFIVNVLHARADEVKTLIALVRQVVKGRFGVSLQEEVVLL